MGMNAPARSVGAGSPDGRVGIVLFAAVVLLVHAFASICGLPETLAYSSSALNRLAHVAGP
jgi:hypothetical protein